MALSISVPCLAIKESIRQGLTGIPAGIWRFCPGPDPGCDNCFSRDFSLDLSGNSKLFNFNLTLNYMFKHFDKVIEPLIPSKFYADHGFDAVAVLILV